MDNTKWWLDSQTVQGALLTYLPPIVMILGVFGVKIGDAETQAIIQGVVGLVGAIGACLAIYGRFKADSKITIEKP